MSSKKKKKDDFIDDGRVIANMNVDGMPHAPFRRKSFDEFGVKPEKAEPVKLTKKERRAVVSGVAASYILYGLIVFGALALFILFCIKIWFE